MDRDPNCIFCKIVNGDIPSYKVYEDEHNLAFLDVHPIAKGHTLVIPKQHADRLTGVRELESYARAVGEVCLRIERGVSKHYNLFAAQGAKAWQTVFHHHIHIIPRFGGEKAPDWPARDLSKEEAHELLKKLTD
jgi:histidine triad (HIT) family protein